MPQTTYWKQSNTEFYGFIQPIQTIHQIYPYETAYMIWGQNDDILYGYIYQNDSNAESISTFNLLNSVWRQDDNVLFGFIQPTELKHNPIKFNINNVYLIWKQGKWWIDGEENFFIKTTDNMIPVMGACYGLSELTEVIIPQSVKHIGPFTFTGTSITNVTIANDCTYYETSFPQNCEINTY